MPIKTGSPRSSPSLPACLKTGIPLSAPSLSAAAFESLLEPFLDPIFFCPGDGVPPHPVDLRPIAGCPAPRGEKAPGGKLLPHGRGSSLIPQVIKAVKGYFPNGAVDCFPDQLSMQTAIARGAALDALFQEIASAR